MLKPAAQTIAPADIAATLSDVARLFSPQAAATILYENGLKHRYEILQILQHLPPQGTAVDVGGGLGVNFLVARRLLPEARLILIDRFVEYTPENRMGPKETGVSLMKEAGIEVIDTDFWPTLSLNLDDDSADVVTSFDVVEHLPGNPIQHFTEIRRILRTGGHFLLGAPNAAALMRRVKLFFGTHPYMAFDDWMSSAYYEHFREYTPDEYRRLLMHTGFDVKSVSCSDAVTRSRAVNRWHHRKHSVLSPHAAALAIAGVIEAAAPRLRQSVYCIGCKPAGQAVG
jgi:SAM-dependent methyltransferase